MLKKGALRIINETVYRAHSNPLCFKHKTLKLDNIYLLQLGTIMYQFQNNELPVLFQDMFITNKQIYSHHTRHSCDFHVSFIRTAQAQNIVTYEGPMFWNIL